MTGCSAPGCHGSDKRGLKVYRFPRNPERRQQWLINCGRKDWNPTPASCLCQKHFETSQFELHRADGKIKLKPNAIPTIFSPPEPVSPSNKRKRVRKNKGKIVILNKRQKSPPKNTQEEETMSPVRKSSRVRKSTFKKAESENELHESTNSKLRKISEPQSNSTPDEDKISSNEISELGIVEIFMDNDETFSSVFNNGNCTNCEELGLENEKLKKENEQLHMEKSKLSKDVSVLRKDMMFIDLALKYLLDEDQQKKFQIIVKTVEHEWEDDKKIS